MTLPPLLFAWFKHPATAPALRARKGKKQGDDMTSDFAAGNYRFIPGVFQYSAGAAANPGYEIERVRFDKWIPLAEGCAHIAKYIQAAGRPLT
jgi:hypothetical protein